MLGLGTSCWGLGAGDWVLGSGWWGWGRVLGAGGQVLGTGCCGMGTGGWGPSAGAGCWVLGLGMETGAGCWGLGLGLGTGAEGWGHDSRLPPALSCPLQQGFPRGPQVLAQDAQTRACPQPGLYSIPRGQDAPPQLCVWLPGGPAEGSPGRSSPRGRAIAPWRGSPAAGSAPGGPSPPSEGQAPQPCPDPGHTQLSLLS